MNMKICVIRLDGENADYYGMLHSVKDVAERIFGKRDVRVEKEHRQIPKAITFDVYPFEEDVDKNIVLFLQEISRLHFAYSVRIHSC